MKPTQTFIFYSKSLTNLEIITKRVFVLPTLLDQQLALMDEDHSRMQALPQQQQQQQQQWQITTRMTTVVSPPTTPSSSRAGASRLFGGAYNSRVDSGSRRNSFAGDASSLPGSPNSGRSGTNPAGSSVDESGGREMTCLEAVDLGDVLGVYQENSAPEQVSQSNSDNTYVIANQISHVSV